MSIHTANTSGYTRHVGTVGDKKVAVIIQLPDSTHEVHVVDTEALPDMYHQNLMDMLMTPQAQSAKWLGEYLHRTMLFDGTNALKTFYEKKWIIPVPTSSVIMTPKPNQQVRLTEQLGIYGDPAPLAPVRPMDDPIAAQQNPFGVQEQSFDEIVAQEQAKLNNYDTPQQPLYNQHAENLRGDLNEESQRIAANLVAEARLLEADALTKRTLAATYDPSTKTQAGVYTPSAESVAQQGYNPLAKNQSEPVNIQISEGAFTDTVTGKVYKTEGALKAAATRRANAETA
jgi:hypothetical protein